MILFDLVCAGGHRFEGWFASSAAFADQQAAGLLACAVCGSHEVAKAVMAPAVGRKGNQRASVRPVAPVDAAADSPAGNAVSNAPARVPGAMGEAAARVIAGLAAAQAKALENSTWVGRQFAEEARAIHYGESAQRSIHGEVSPKEAAALAEEGVPCAPLPLPVAPPDRLH